MDILNNEMHFEVLCHLDLYCLLKINRLNKQYYGYLLNKNLWIIYLKHKNQAEYRKIIYKISKHCSGELFKVLDSNYHNKVMESRMIRKVYHNIVIYDNNSMIEYTGYCIDHKVKDFKNRKVN